MMGAWDAEKNFPKEINEGKVPYLQSELEYPVLTGFIMELGRRWVALLGGASEPGASSEAMLAASEMFFGLTAVLMFVFFLSGVAFESALEFGRCRWGLCALVLVITAAAAARNRRQFLQA